MWFVWLYFRGPKIVVPELFQYSFGTACDCLHGKDGKWLFYMNVFKNGPSKVCGRQHLKNLKWHVCLEFFKGCLPQILHNLLLNTLSHIYQQFCEDIWFLIVNLIELVSYRRLTAKRRMSMGPKRLVEIL